MKFDVVTQRDTSFCLAFEMGEFSFLTFGINVHFPSTLGSLLPLLIAADIGMARNEIVQCVEEGLLLQSQDTDSAFQCIGYNSVVPHELRHFHDFLSTRTGSEIFFGEAALASYNSFLLADLMQEDTFVVPIQRWMDLDDDTYHALRATGSGASLRRTPPPRATKLASPATNAVQHIFGYLGTPPGDHSIQLSIRELLESSALSVQMASIWEHNKDYSPYPNLKDWFRKQIRERDQKGTYWRVWDYWYMLEQELGLPMPCYEATRNAVVFFSLNATPSDLEMCHPSDVFLQLMHAMRRERIIPSPEESLDWLDAQAGRLGLLGLEESLNRSIESCHDRITSLRRTGTTAECILKAYDCWADSCEYMCKTILDEPMKYFEPLYYLNNMDKWVAAPRFETSDTPILEPELLGEIVKRGLDRFDPKSVRGWGEDWSVGLGRITPGVELIPKSDATALSVAFRLAHAFWYADHPDVRSHLQRHLRGTAFVLP